METSDAVVVGAGVVGCATAYWLARAGLSVTVVERDRIADHGSSAPASVLAPLTDGDSGPLVDAGWASLEILREVEDELEEEASLEPRIAATGVLRLADEADATSMIERAARLADFGCSWLDRGELDAWDPRFDPRFVGALWSPRECSVDGGRLTTAFARAAEHHGARFAVETPVVGLATSEGCVAGVLAAGEQLFAAGDTIICSGAWSSEFAHWLGVPVPVEASRGSQTGFAAPSPNLPGVVCEAGLRLIPTDGAVWIDDVDESSDPVGADRGRLERCDGVLSGLAEREPVGSWSGASARTPDQMPLLGRVPGVDGVTLATGYGRHGVLLSALSASGIVELLVEGKLPDELVPFTPERF